MKRCGFVFVALAIASMPAPGAQTFHFSGTTVGADGEPVPGAAVQVYQSKGEGVFMRGDMDLVLALTTSGSGAFEFALPQRPVLVVARKPGLATTWQQYWTQKREMSERITLLPTKGLAGKVVDKAGNPVPGAEIWVRMAYLERALPSGFYTWSPLSGRLGRECFSTTSELDGSFRFPDFPPDASADLAVRVPGMFLPIPEREMLNPESMQFRSGQPNVRVQLEPAGTLEGRTVTEGARQPLKGVRLSLVPGEPAGRLHGEVLDVESDVSGLFRFHSVPPGSHRVQAAFGTNALPGWVAESVAVSAEAGVVVSNVEIVAVRGGLLELQLKEQDGEREIPAASIEARGERLSVKTTADARGRAQLRLSGGEYRLFVYADGWNNSTDQKATVRANETNRLTIALTPVPKIFGIVTDPSGKPVPHVTLQVVPSYTASGGESTTDAQGHYELSGRPQRVLAGPDRSVALLARDVGRNLAIAHDLDENTQELNLTLEPAMTVIAQVKDVAGKPLTNGTAELVVWGGNSGSHLGEPFAADSEGRIEISALPPGRRFSLWLGAKGYGRISQNVPQDSDTNRVVLEPVSLKAIDRKISGRVVDADEQAAAGVRVSVQGENQPLTYGRTDEQGRFEFEVCEGSVRVYANSSRAGSYASGNATVQGGETNIVVKLGVNSSSASRRAVSRTSLQGKALPDLSGMGYKAPVPMNKPVLLCLLDIGQRPSRRAARVLADKWEKLRSANVHVLGLQAVPVAAETLKEWSASNTVPFEVGMVPPQAGAARWASQAPSLPWLLLTDANGRVKSEGFSLDDLEAKLNAANQ